MNCDEIKQIKILLEQWEDLLDNSHKKSCHNAKISYRNLNHKTQSPNNKPIIFDQDGYAKQTHIQAKLCSLLPDLKCIINAEPDINDYNWKIGDYLELYFNHYRIIIQKIRKFGINSEKK